MRHVCAQVNVLVEKCVSSETQRPYPSGIIEKCLRDLHFAVDPTKAAKVQALDQLPKLRANMPHRSESPSCGVWS